MWRMWWFRRTILWLIVSLFAYFWRILFFWSDMVLCPTFWGPRLMLPKKGFSKNLVLSIMTGFYELDWKMYFDYMIKSAKVFIDIGAAADGYHSLRAFKLNKYVRVFAIEPLKHEFLWLIKNLLVNKAINRVFPLKLALGSIDEEVKLNDERVPMRRLDGLLKELNEVTVDIIKIDVEGMGLDVIKGGLETLQEHKPIIFMEMHNKVEEKALKLVCDLGYNVVKLSPRYVVMLPMKRQTEQLLHK